MFSSKKLFSSLFTKILGAFVAGLKINVLVVPFCYVRHYDSLHFQGQ